MSDDDFESNAMTVADVLFEYGAAFRHSWAEIDGRCVRDDMETFAAALQRPIEVPISRLRARTDLCPAGNGHWTDFCGKGCEVPA